MGPRTRPAWTRGAHTVIIAPQPFFKSRLAWNPMPSKVPDGERRGWIVPIGGAENKENDPHILQRFVALAGGEQADIVVIPTASQLNETGPRYQKLFSELGASAV